MPCPITNRLIGYAGNLPLEHGVEQFTRGGEMKEGEDNLPGGQEVVLLLERLLYLDDDLSAGKDLFPRDDLRPGLVEFLVGDAAAESRAGLYQDLLAGLIEYVHSRRSDSDSPFIFLDFTRNSDHAWHDNTLLKKELRRGGLQSGKLNQPP